MQLPGVVVLPLFPGNLHVLHSMMRSDVTLSEEDAAARLFARDIVDEIFQ